MSQNCNPSIVEQIFRNAENTPDKTAVVIGEHVLSYRMLTEQVDRVAQSLQEFGVCPGDRVTLSAGYSSGFIPTYFAIHRIGAIAVPLDPQLPHEKRTQIETIVSPSRSIYHKAVPAEPNAILFEDLLPSSQHISTAMSFPTPEQTADILFTTGTSGIPKGVMLSHNNLIAAANNINRFIGNGSDDCEVMPLPLYHSFGLGRLRCVLSRGGTFVQANGFMFAKELFNLMDRYHATGFCFVPAGCAILFNLTGDKLGEYAHQLRYIEIGSSTMPLEHKTRLMRLLPNTRICMHYGLTEASRSAFIEFHAAKDRLDSIGQASPGAELGILDDSGRILPPGAIGELCVRGKHVMQGYWGNIGIGDETFSDGWLRTGDTGYVTEDGYYYLQGRTKDLINVGGKKVSPVEIEDAIKQHPAILDCACIAIPDPDGFTGEAIKAFLVPKTATKPEFGEIGAYLNERLESYQIPKLYQWIDAIPKTESGKIQRNKLSDR